MDQKRTVARGYDRMAERYNAWAVDVRVQEREHYTRALLDALPEGAAVLELGCGAGLPTTRAFAERFGVTGVDISERQIALARRNVPGARFVHADMAGLDLPPGSYDGVAAFYSLTHVPREEHGALLARIAGWLRPGGLFVGSMGAGPSEGEWEFHGVPMVFSHYDATTNRRLVADAGLAIESARVETEDEDGEPTPFLWVVARKARDAG